MMEYGGKVIISMSFLVADGYQKKSQETGHKELYVCPIHKKRDRKEFQFCRAIALLNEAHKILAM